MRGSTSGSARLGDAVTREVRGTLWGLRSRRRRRGSLSSSRRTASRKSRVACALGPSTATGALSRPPIRAAGASTNRSPGSRARLRLSPIALFAVGEGRQSLPIGRSPGGVESGCAEVILSEVRLRTTQDGPVGTNHPRHRRALPGAFTCKPGPTVNVRINCTSLAQRVTKWGGSAAHPRLSS